MTQLKQIPFSEWRRLNGTDTAANMPCILTLEGVAFAVVVNPADIIVLSDLHPAVVFRLRNIEQQARAGMPKPLDIRKAEELRTGE